MPEHLLSAREVAAVLRVSRSYAYVLIRRGDLRAVQLGRLLRVRQRDLDRYLSTRERLGGPGPSSKIR